MYKVSCYSAKVGGAAGGPGCCARCRRWCTRHAPASARKAGAPLRAPPHPAAAPIVSALAALQPCWRGPRPLPECFPDLSLFRTSCLPCPAPALHPPTPGPQVTLECLHEMFENAKHTMHWLRCVGGLLLPAVGATPMRGPCPACPKPPLPAPGSIRAHCCTPLSHSPPPFLGQRVRAADCQGGARRDVAHAAGPAGGAAIPPQGPAARAHAAAGGAPGRAAGACRWSRQGTPWVRDAICCTPLPGCLASCIHRCAGRQPSAVGACPQRCSRMSPLRLALAYASSCGLQKKPGPQRMERSHLHPRPAHAPP